MRLLIFILVFMLPASGCSGRPPASDYPRVASYAMADTANTALGKTYGPLASLHPGESGFHLLSNGPEALMVRIALIESAQRSIDLQYFSTRDDTTGKLLLEALCRAADRGVRVRMLLDDWNLDDFENGAVALNENLNISLRVFNPYATRDQSLLARMGNVFSYAGSFNRRMHNKAMIVDNQVTIIGGRNLGDEYFGAGQDINLSDADVFAAGPITPQISKNFDRYWNSNESFPVDMLNLPDPKDETVAKIRSDMDEHWQTMLKSRTGKSLNQLPLPYEIRKGNASLIWAKAEFVADSPRKIEKPADESTSAPDERIDELVADAQHEFSIITPYFVPLNDGVDWLNDLGKRGVHVRIITNSLASTDMVPAQAGYEHYREALVKGGVDLYEIKSDLPHPPIKKMFKPSSQYGLHAKIYMIDRRSLVIGSFNLDARSIRLNTEQVLVIHSEQLCAEVAQLFDKISAPDRSFHVVLASTIPASEQSLVNSGSLVWETEENGQNVYYDFNPHAGFWRRLTDGFFSILPIDDQL